MGYFYLHFPIMLKYCLVSTLFIQNNFNYNYWKLGGYDYEELFISMNKHYYYYYYYYYYLK